MVAHPHELKPKNQDDNNEGLVKAFVKQKNKSKTLTYWMYKPTQSLALASSWNTAHNEGLFQELSLSSDEQST